MGRAEDIFDRIKVNGEKAITEFVQTRQCEELFLDFKRSSDQGKGHVLDQKDRNHLAKAISGFGNSEGGVIVWGLDCSKDMVGADVVKAKCPILDVTKFVSWIEGAVSGCTIPPHSGVLNHVVETNEQGHGYVVTYIPKSENVPHQTVKDLRYYIRAGSSFSPTPHQVLAGMFGRRPQPRVLHRFEVKPARIGNKGQTLSCSVGCLVENRGPGIGWDPFVSCRVISRPGQDCRVSFFLSSKRFIKHEHYGCFSAIGEQGFGLPPGSWLEVVEIYISLCPPFESGLKVDGVMGCGNVPPHRFHWESSRNLTEQLYHEVMQSRGLTREPKLLRDFGNRLLSI